MMAKADELRRAESSRSVDRRSLLKRSVFGAAGVGTVAGTFPGIAGCSGASDASLRVATFEVDATPEVGSAVAYGKAKQIDDPLSCRGIVLLPDNQPPIVLTAVDWIGIGNDGQTVWKEHLARAADTSPRRVAVHTLHQHEAPGCDFSAKRLLLAHGVDGGRFDEMFALETIRSAAAALEDAVQKAQPVTHIGTGRAEVKKVASNRQLLGPDGKILVVRYTSEPDPKIRALPEGLIDPHVRSLSFWNGDQPLANLTYYATHPQSHYGNRRITTDFVGLARNQRQEDTGVFHLHFDGAGGNIGAGKYNDGSEKMRPVLKNRLAKGMAKAWENTERVPVSASDLDWTIQHVVLPPAERYNEQDLIEDLKSEPDFGTAKALAWVHRCNTNQGIDLQHLRIGPARVLHMPGELFVEYQLSAQSMRSGEFVAMAAYSDYACGYIGTEAAYPKGGYEVGDASDVAPRVEHVLAPAMRDLLEVGDNAGHDPSWFTLNKKPLINADLEEEAS